MIIAILCAVFNPFFEGNFTAAAGNAAALFENPAGLGRELIAEEMFTCIRDTLANRLVLNRIGFGVLKHESAYTGEVGIGLNPAGLFAAGYGLRFNLSGGRQPTTHYLGCLTRFGAGLAAGFRFEIFRDTTRLDGGIALAALSRHMLLAWDGQYETRTDDFDYHWGIQLRFNSYVGGSFQTCREIADWHAGVGFGYQNLHLAVTYSASDKSFGAGLLIGISAN